MSLVVLTTCTDRKRRPVATRLRAATLPRGDQEAVAREWRQRICAANSAATAAEVYGGRSFQEALAAAKGVRADLYIISGGLGLITAASRIPAYSLAISRGGPDYVGERISTGQFDAARWWSQMNDDSRDKAPLSSLISSQQDLTCAIAVSSSYAGLIAADLESLPDTALQRIRIMGLGVASAFSPRVQACVLPYDDRLDGPASDVRGTRSDFAQRALRHFVERIWRKTPDAPLAAHIGAVDAYLAPLGRAPKFSRQSKTDDEIIDIIKQAWDVTGGRSGRMLRYLRDELEIACEQGRFRDLFKRAAEQVTR